MPLTETVTLTVRVSEAFNLSFYHFHCRSNISIVTVIIIFLPLYTYFEMGCMHSCGDVHTGHYKMYERSKVPLTKNGQKMLRVNKALYRSAHLYQNQWKITIFSLFFKSFTVIYRRLVLHYNVFINPTEKNKFLKRSLIEIFAPKLHLDVFFLLHLNFQLINKQL